MAAVWLQQHRKAVGSGPHCVQANRRCGGASALSCRDSTNALGLSVDAVTLLVADHTDYNLVGVAILLPLIDPYRLIKRIVPKQGYAFMRCLDLASLAAPTVAVGTVRRTMARVVDALFCRRTSVSKASDGMDQAALP
jgi:Na+/phosphate symporter